MMKLIIGNKNYSSWSLRAWLAAKQSGLPFEELTVPLFGEEWEGIKLSTPELQPSKGKVPILWDGDAVVWDSLAIVDYLADKVGRDRFWPKADDARAMARSMTAEMHSSYMAFRKACPMNIRGEYAGLFLSDEARADILRILQIWAEARSRFGQGGPYLFGAFCAADIFFAPVISRFRTYGIVLPGFAEAYADAIWHHEWLQSWIEASHTEEWVIEKFEMAV